MLVYYTDMDRFHSSADPITRSAVFCWRHRLWRRRGELSTIVCSGYMLVMVLRSISFDVCVVDTSVRVFDWFRFVVIGIVSARWCEIDSVPSPSANTSITHTCLTFTHTHNHSHSAQPPEPERKVINSLMAITISISWRRRRTTLGSVRVMLSLSGLGLYLHTSVVQSSEWIYNTFASLTSNCCVYT